MDKPRQISPGDIEAAISSLQRRLDETGADGGPQRIDCSPESIEQGLARLVLSLIELLRRLLERQAIRRMDGGSLSDQEIENMGAALMKLEAKIQELAGHFGLTMADLNLDLGPLGNLLEK
jgi:gas vesicle protein GvpK